ncbi:MAG: MoaD/ThiS family protein [Terrimicrobiaceae bacterium]
MNVLYFAQAADAAGCREEEWVVDGTLLLEEFWAEAIRRHPALEIFSSQCRVASAGNYVGAGERLDPRSEVAVIPPVSGG